MDAYYDAIRWLPAEVKASLGRLSARDACFISEIRLRSGRPLCACSRKGDLFFSKEGPVLNGEKDVLFLSHSLITQCFLALCRYSVHSHARALENGYLSLPGGHRAGVCGSAFYLDDGRFSVQNITSINLRIARAEVSAIPETLSQTLRKMKSGIVLAGEPGSGKTTLLRSSIRALSEAGEQVAVVDERGELLPVGSEGFDFSPPLRCDVLSGYPKHIGMQHALRGLAPDVLLCDEVGSLEDVEAIKQAANAGVKLLVSIHGQNRSGLMRRPQFRTLLKTGAFDWVLFLKGRSAPGEIMEAWNVADEF